MSKATSIDAYRNLSQTNHFSYLQSLILQNIEKHGPATRKELAARIQKPINSVCDPVLRLLEARKLIETEVVDPETNRKINMLSIPGRKGPAKAQSKPTTPSPTTPKASSVNLDAQNSSLTAQPSNKELLCSAILKTQFQRVGDEFVAQVIVNNLVMMVKFAQVSTIEAV